MRATLRTTAAPALAILLLGGLLIPAPAEGWRIDPGLLQEYPVLGQAIALARQDAQSDEGVDCFINGPLDTGMDPNNFDDDDEGPEIMVEDLVGAYGEFRHVTAPDTIFIDTQLVMDAQSGDARAMEVLVATIVHETTHWVDHNADGGHDTMGEEGCAMEAWIYGFIKQYWNVDGIPVEPVTALGSRRAGGAATAELLACSPTSPSTLALSLSMPRTSYALGDPVVLTLTLTNVSTGLVEVIDRFEIEGLYVTLEVLGPDGSRVEYEGVEIRPVLPAQLFVTLEPGESLTRSVEVEPPSGGYPLDDRGTYSITASYTLPPFGCLPFARYLMTGEVRSNTVQVNVR